MGKYKLVVYNAGDGVDMDGDLAESKAEYELNVNSPEELRDFLKCTNLKQIIGAEGVTAELFYSLQEKIDATKGKKAQG